MDAKIVAFDVKRLGYYKYQGDAVAEAPTKSELLQEFIDWGRGKSSIDETKLVTIPHEDDKNLGYYFIDGASNEDKTQFVFVMWRESATDGGKVYGVRKDAEPGVDNQMESKEFNPERFIPGFPSYFWFDAPSNTLSNIVFSHSSSSKRHLVLFFKEFLRRETDLTEVSKNEDGETKFKHFVTVTGDKKPTRLFPKFDLSTLKVDEILSFLKEHQNEIIGVRRDEDLSYVKKAEPHKLPNYLTTLFSFLESKDRQKLTKSQRRFTYEMDWSPTDADLDLLVSEAQAAIEDDAIIKDIKLKFKDGSYKSVKEIQRRVDSNLDLIREDEEFFSAEHLLTVLSNRRDRLLEELHQ